VSATSTGLAHVTVSAPGRRLDVALPDGVPLAELLPDLLVHAGEELADRGEEHGGWVLRRSDGSPLSGAGALAAQGVRDGDVLHLAPAREHWPEPEYDDVAEAIAAGARRYGPGWSGTATTACGLAAAGVALAVGLVVAWRSGPAVPLGVAAVLLVAGVLASRAYGAGVVGAGLAGYALPYAALGGARLVAGPGAPLVASTALLVASLLGAVAVGGARRLFAAGTVAGLVGVAGALTAFFGGGAGAAAAVLAALVTGVAGVPLLAIRLGRLPMPAVTLSDDGRADREVVYAAVARTDRLLTGMLLGVAVSAVGASVVLARSGGPAGRLLVAVAAAAFLLRARLFVTVWQRLPLLGAGVLALAALVVLGLPARPVAAAIVLLAAALLAAALLATAAGTRYAGRAPSPYLGRAADLLDALCVVSVLPVACAVLGLYAQVRHLMG